LLQFTQKYQVERVRGEKKQVYGRRDGCGMVGHSLVFCALGVIRSWFFVFVRLAGNGLRYEHVAGFGAVHYQTAPKLDARSKVK